MFFKSSWKAHKIWRCRGTGHGSGFRPPYLVTSLGHRPRLFSVPNPDVEPISDTMEAIVAGPAESPYEGGTFRLRIQVPPDYPFRRRGWGLINWKLGMSATRCGRMRRPKFKCVEIAICSVTAAQTQEKGIIVATLWNVEGIETCVLVKFPRYKRQSNHMSFQWTETETNKTTMMVHDGAYMCILSTVHFSILTTWPRIELDFCGLIYFLSADRSASLQGRQESNSWRRFGYQVSIPSMVAWPHLDGTVLWIDWIDWIGDDRGSLAAPCVQALWKSGCWICIWQWICCFPT